MGELRFCLSYRCRILSVLCGKKNNHEGTKDTKKDTKNRFCKQNEQKIKTQHKHIKIKSLEICYMKVPQYSKIQPNNE